MMNAAFLLIPFILIRYVLLKRINPQAYLQAGQLTPLQGEEKIAYYVYTVSVFAIFVSLFFLPVVFERSALFIFGALFYCLGIQLLLRSIIAYARPRTAVLLCEGAYRCSRNPMYVAYGLILLGLTLLTQSGLLLVLTGILQVSTHWMILSEERWCTQTFGDDYVRYMRRTRRYIGIYPAQRK